MLDFFFYIGNGFWINLEVQNLILLAWIIKVNYLI